MVTLRRSTWLPIVVAVCLLGGCRSTAPVARWQPPRLADPAGQKIVLGEIRGPREITQPLREALLAAESNGRGEPLWVAAETLRSEPIVQFAAHRRRCDVSKDNESETQIPGDLLLASAARRSGAGYVLVGEVLRKPPGRRQTEADLTISWRLTGLGDDATTEGWPVRVDDDLVQEQHPHLLLCGDRDFQLRQAAVLQTRALLSASTRRDRATLARPRGTPGAAEVRRANRLAAAGNWPAAQKIWLDVTRRNPSCAAAWINASVAAVAGQRFDSARHLADEGLRRSSGWRSTLAPGMTDLARQNVVWIELVRRDYHEAFHLPPPPGGWSVTGGKPSTYLGSKPLHDSPSRASPPGTTRRVVERKNTLRPTSLQH